MGKDSPTPTAESAAIKAALLRQGTGASARLAAAVGQSPAFVSAWSTGRRPVPAGLALAVAEFLGLQPEQVSTSYVRLAPHVAPSKAPAALPPDVQRTPNDVRAINLALAALSVAMVKHRPAEALDAAASLRALAPKAFRERGLLKELLETLDAAAPQGKRRAG